MAMFNSFLYVYQRVIPSSKLKIGKSSSLVCHVVPSQSLTHAVSTRSTQKIKLTFPRLGLCLLINP